MKLVMQRVTHARVEVDGEEVGAIGHGLVIFVGVGREDGVAVAERLADKTVGLRMFDDAEGKTNLSLLDVSGEALVVSQFTLFADCRKGRRPSFSSAGEPVRAAELVEVFRRALEQRGVGTASGRFAAHMKVHLLNDGPFTICLDSEDL
ncbi:MAG: D-tyrosyl-tRNA(Tyr) deacylase [Gaiellales bacterium]|nr:D-tyrosyl-tRNA(Tyr) deacylase [Gaiellales bacterium]